MTNSIHQVFKYVCRHQGFRASLGIISSTSKEKTMLAWGAIHASSGETWVPELNNMLSSWPDARWTPMNQQQASLFDQAFERETKPGQDWLMSV
ncbi:hypothetical protein [Reinekea marinisedimentorum]|uniref:Uncharacterized protein n=1 Tax=Reinekea marinisedimentorum TaxID=230495 RepID=A0A4R3HWK1_9GAMM|nr:hypothetical protein [Reinekea marinisedimentorum]TCS37666.1 hypothetical protein BCF53_11825 [Reinekea marinisedimentorum]